MAHRNSTAKKIDSLTTPIPTNGQFSHEDNPNHNVYKKVSYFVISSIINVFIHIYFLYVTAFYYKIHYFVIIRFI